MIPIDWEIFGPAIVMASGALLALCADLLTAKRSFVLSWLPMLAGTVGALVLDVRTADRARLNPAAQRERDAAG
jgi:hypothetical protein